MNTNVGFTRREAMMTAAGVLIPVPDGAPRPRETVDTGATGPVVGNDVFSLISVTSVDARANWNEAIPKTANQARTPDIDITGCGLITGILAVYDERMYPATFRDSAGNAFVLGPMYLPPADKDIHVSIQPFYCIAPKGGAGWHIESIGSPHHSILVGAWKTSVPIQESAQQRRSVEGPNPGAVTPARGNMLVVTGAAGVNNGGRTAAIGRGFTLIDGYSGRGVDLICAQAALAQRAAATVTPMWENIGNEVCSALMVFEPRAA
jgi:hypothetical protein